jgi:hypothetical protein
MPPAPLREQLPAVLLVGLLLLLSLSLVYPSAAYPYHGVGFAGGAILLLACCLPLLFGQPGGAALAMIPGLLWAAYWLVRTYGAPLYADAREETATVFAATGVFFVALVIPLVWPGEIVPRREEPRHLSPLLLFPGWLTVAIAAIAANGIYQVLGPAWAPGTFGAMERDILETMAESDPMRDGLLHAVREGRAASTLGAANIFASFCLFALPLAAAGFLATGRLPGRCLYGVSFVLLAGGIVLSGSNGGVLCAVGAGFVFGALMLLQRLARRTAIRVIVGGAVALVLVIGGLVAVSVLSPQHGWRWLGYTGMQQRFFYWQTAWNIWMQHPLLGGGPAAFEVLYPQFRVPGSNETRHAHSWFFEYGASVGVVGLALFLSMVGVAARAATRALQRLSQAGDGVSATLVAGLAAGLCGLLAHGLIEYTFFHREGCVFFFAALGFVTGVGTRLCAPPPGQGRGSKGGWIVVLLFVPAWCVVVALFQVGPAGAWQAREAATGALQEEGGYTEALASAEDAVSGDPDDARNFELRGYLRQQAGDPRALDDYQRAIGLSPHSARLREMVAMYHAARKDWARALEFQTQAVSLHPLDAMHLLNLADLYMKSGDRGQAVVAYRRTLTILLPTAAERRRQVEIARQLGEPPPS